MIDNFWDTGYPLSAANNLKQLLDDLFEDSVEAISDILAKTKELRAADLLHIADEITLQSYFLQEYSRQHEEKQEVIKDVYYKLSAAISRTISENKYFIETIDIYFQRFSFALVIGGAGALIWGSAAIGTVSTTGPVAIAVGGIVGLGLCVLGRRRTVSRAVELEVQLHRVERILEKMEDQNDIT